MKIFKHINNLLIAVLFIGFYAGSMAALGVDHKVAIAGFTALSVGLSFVPKVKGGILAAGIYREAWTGEIQKYVTAATRSSFLDGISDYSRLVSNVGDEAQAIHLASMNILPEVLINNLTYAIGIADLPIQDILIPLDKFDTVATPITDDEIYASTVNKMASVKERHGLAISIKMIKKSLHALSPSSDTAKMPVLLTTGPDDGTGRKRLLMENILTLKVKADDMEIDEELRRLVLSSEHVSDLIYQDPKLEAFFYNRSTGSIQPNLLGFGIYQHVSTPYYNPTTKQKLSFGAVPAATDRKASTFFSLDRAAKAMGWTKMYYSKSEEDTQYHRSLVNFRQYGIVLPTAEEHRGAIVSANV